MWPDAASPSPASRATWTHSARPASSTGPSWSGLAAALDAGLDQFGGDDCTEHIVELVRSGQVSEERVDVSARRLLREKFRLGLFENRHVDPDHASQLCGSRPLRAADRAAQSDYTVLVKNDVQSLDHVDRAVEEATPFFREHLAARGTPSGHRRAPLHRSEGQTSGCARCWPASSRVARCTRGPAYSPPRSCWSAASVVSSYADESPVTHLVRWGVHCRRQERPTARQSDARAQMFATNTTEHPRACTPVSYTNRTSG